MAQNSGRGYGDERGRRPKPHALVFEKPLRLCGLLISFKGFHSVPETETFDLGATILAIEARSFQFSNPYFGLEQRKIQENQGFFATSARFVKGFLQTALRNETLDISSLHVRGHRVSEARFDVSVLAAQASRLGIRETTAYVWSFHFL